VLPKRDSCTHASSSSTAASSRASRRRYRTIVPDLLGSGRSTPWPDGKPFTFHHDVDLVATLLQRLAQPAHLVGHSCGGVVALRAATDDPASVRPLALYDPVAFGVLDRVADSDAWANLDTLHFDRGTSPEEHEAWLEAFVTYWNGAKAWPLLRGVTRTEFVRTGWVAHEHARSVVADRPPASAYDHLSCPTLFLTDSATPLAAGRVIEHVAAAIPSPRTQRIEGADHMRPLTHGDHINELIATHLAAARS
jgi:pimeloyl-ACP methyl ester carboxylesterase